MAATQPTAIIPPPRQHPLPRLFIPPAANGAQAVPFNDNASLFSPMPQVMQPAPPPPFPMPVPGHMHPLQTPVQQNFFPMPPPNAPGRPTLHRAHPSVVQLAAAGILPPPGMLAHPPGVPMTPLGQTGFPSGPLMPIPFQPAFVPKSRRAQSISTGGPPKAVLGGPQRKVSPLPPPTPVVQVTPATIKGKKIVVNLPKETVKNEDGTVGRSEWAREPLSLESWREHLAQVSVQAPELTTSEPFPPDSWRHHLPPTVDVFLPGKAAWDSIKQRIIEEKLEKLGVEKGTGSTSSSTVPHIHAPHARAASISSPADPALLFFKLNKLQQSQNNSTNASLSSSPQPPTLSVSPSISSNSLNINVPNSGSNMPQPRFPPRHGHSLSLAQPPSFQSASPPVYNPTAAFNPFGPSAVLGSDQIFTPYRRVSPDTRAESSATPILQTPLSALPPPLLVPRPESRPESRPDFMRGFGVDIPEEEEPEEESTIVKDDTIVEITVDASRDTDEGGPYERDSEGREELMDEEAKERQDTDVEDELDQDDVSTVAQSRMHSRHVSRLSAALSLVSVGRTDDPVMLGDLDEQLEMPVPVTMPLAGASSLVQAGVEAEGTDEDAAEEWTGSEDLRTGAESSDDESIGEWSNPSDEERARKDRSRRRAVRQAALLKRELEIPRRLPNFPRPPDDGHGYLTGRSSSGTQHHDDDDLISNPSEEERLKVHDTYLELDSHEHYSRPASTLSGHGRPLPPLPHSRSGSAQYSHHDPALAHSRNPSEQYPQPGGLRPPPASAAPGATFASRKDSLTLNPLAKPFVFGFGTTSFGSSSHVPPPTAPATTTTFGMHARAPSLGKPLNATAQEFKPTGFTFRPPPGVPQLTFSQPSDSIVAPAVETPEPMTARPLPIPPSLPSPVRAVQGREKRQRLGSTGSTDLASEGDYAGEDEDEDEDEAIDDEATPQVDNMHSFRFPPLAPPAADVKLSRHSAPTTPPDTAIFVGFGDSLNTGSLNATTKPFTFAEFNAPAVASSTSEGGLPLNRASLIEPPLAESSPPPPSAKKLQQQQNEGASELPFPPTATKPRRAPIPLDFKHPVSNNTVPAGLFKNLDRNQSISINMEAEERTRRTVRSRLSSRDIFEHSHSPRPSLDDLDVPPISHRMPQRSSTRVFSSPEPNDVFSSARRRSSLPARRSAGGDGESASDVSVAPMNLSRRVEMQQYEQRLEEILDEKMDAIKAALEEYRQQILSSSPTAVASQDDAGTGGLSSSSEAMIQEVVSLFRTQLQESAARSLEEAQADARGELDFEVLKGIIEQGHAETRSLIQRDLSKLLVSQDHTSASHVQNAVQELSERVLNHFTITTSQLTHHIRALENSSRSSATEREAIVLDVIAGLAPHLAAVRSEPTDYEGLTARLTQAVKPHISQLIDLASDKRETAGLIVDALIPILPTLPLGANGLQEPFDVEDVVSRLVSEVRKVVAPLDTHEIKEQVSDLVVERLDSRLAVRDKAFNVDVVTEKVAETVGGLLGPVRALEDAVENLNKTMSAPPKPSTPPPRPEVDIGPLKQGVLDLLKDLPGQLGAATDALGGARSDLKSQQERLEREDLTTKSIQQIESKLSLFAEEQEKLITQNTELSDFCQDIVKHINSLPEAMLEATKVLQNAHADIIERDTSAKDSEEIRRLMSANSELSSQLAKARGAHGQVRVEKDMLGERLRIAETERDRVRTQADQMQETVTSKVAEAAAMDARNRELEEALAQALERIKSSDVVVQTNLERISSLEKTVQTLSDEKYQLKSEVDSLETKASYAVRDKESIAEDLVELKRQHDDVLSQRSHWDELHRMHDSLQSLAGMLSRDDSEELKELRRTKDKVKAMELENATLQRRLKDQETKAANNERTAQTARQSLTQAQQRASEWEQRAREYEQDLESMRDRLDHAEQVQTQLDTDLSLVKLQLDERDAEERLAKDRESKLRDQIAALDESVTRLRAEADQAKKEAATAVAAAAASSTSTSTSTTRPTIPTVSSRLRPNGSVFVPANAIPPPRPDSRASTVFGDSRITTPTPPANGVHHANPSIRAETPPQQSVWHSIHAPMTRRENPSRMTTAPVTPKPKKHSHTPYYPRAPSPTPSNVSAAPTLGNDGWWS